MLCYVKNNDLSSALPATRRQCRAEIIGGSSRKLGLRSYSQGCDEMAFRIINKIHHSSLQWTGRKAKILCFENTKKSGEAVADSEGPRGHAPK